MDIPSIPEQMTPFARQQQRGAYAVFRGFLYQVQRTVIAWLDLDENTILFCECGEDIDHVRNTLDEDNGQIVQERVLEQIKYRGTRSLSLNSREIIEALGNYLVLRDANPDHSVTYRFFTNATTMPERGYSFPKRLTGIEAWRQARTGELNPHQAQQSVRLARRILYDSATKHKAAIPSAEAVLQFLSSCDDETIMIDLVMNVDWAIGNLDIHELQVELGGKVMQLGYGSSPAEVEELVRRLTVHVLNMLSSPGEKCLDKSSLKRVVQQGTVAEVDRKLLTVIHDFLRDNKEKIDYIAQGVASLQEGQAEIKAQIRGSFGGLGIPGGLGLGPATGLGLRAVPDTPPMPAAILAPREALVCQIESQLQSRVCVSLVASSGMGKTQLARSIWDRRQGINKTWISLRGEASLLHHHFDQQLLCWYSQMIGDDGVWQDYALGQISGTELAMAVATLAGSGTLIIVDDLPQQRGTTLLGERLAALGEALNDAGGRMLVTSQHPLPTHILDVFGSRARDFPIPSMDAHDVAALFDAAQAPVHLATQEVADLLLSLTKGHPRLLAITVLWLERNQWDLAGEGFSALLAGEPLSQAKGETRRSVRDMIQDAYTRELLDRLSLLDLPFDLEMLWAVAAVGQSIPRARERLDELIGPWVQPLGRSLFEISALLRDAGSKYLPVELQQEVHRAIAWKYLAVKSVPAEYAIQISIHLLKAEDWRGLAAVLIKLLLTIQTPEEARYFELMRFYFPPQKTWPTSLSLSERITIRALQIRLMLLSGKSDTLYDADLEELIANASSEEALAVCIARIHTGPFLEQVGPETTALRAIQASRAYRQMENQLPENLPLPPEILYWAAVGKLTDSGQIQGLIEVLRSMTDEERKIVLTTSPGPQMAMFLADACYAWVAEKEPLDSDWRTALGFLDELEDIGRLEGGEPLWVAARRARAIVFADYLLRTDDALERLQEPNGELGEASTFLLEFTRACILLAKDRADEAFGSFHKAIALDAKQEYPFLFYDALRRGMQAAARVHQWQHAIAWCKAALALATAGESADRYESLELIGELAWIRWCMGQRRKACAALHGVVCTLTAVGRVNDTRYKETFFKVGHVLGWVASLATKGLPPTTTSAGDVYAAPYPGILCTRKPAIGEWESIPRKPILLYQLAMMAVGVGCLRLAKSTYSKAIRSADAEGMTTLSCSAHMELAPVQVYLGDFGEALSHAIVGMEMLAVSPQLEASTSVLGEGLDPGAAWESLTTDKKSEIESFVFFHYALLPARVSPAPCDAKCSSYGFAQA